MGSKIMLIGFIIAMLCLQSGCGLNSYYEPQTAAGQDTTNALLQHPQTVDPGSQQMQRRFDSRQQNDPESRQGAVVWAQRYEELSSKNSALLEKNTEIRVENNELKQKVSELETELAETKKELSEANVFLQQMHVELTDWKSNVLGFREEMRHAQKVQVEALAKVLRVLGAESIEDVNNESDSQLN